MLASLKKLLISFLAILPVMAVVLILHLTKVAELSGTEVGVFLISTFIAMIGMFLFNIGSESSMQKMGELVGSSITKRRSIFLIVN